MAIEVKQSVEDRAEVQVRQMFSRIGGDDWVNS
jgi:hypothetical protein